MYTKGNWDRRKAVGKVMDRGNSSVLTEGRLLDFCNCCNAVTMFLANVLARGIHPPENIQNGGHLGGGDCLS